MVDVPRIGYVLKMYPRYSETFVVNELLALEAAGVQAEIFSLRPPVDAHFQDAISRVRAPVTYLSGGRPKAEDLWAALTRVAAERPQAWTELANASGHEAGDVYQAAQLAHEIRARGIGHLHAHFGTVATTVARLAARLAGVTYTFTTHAKDIFLDGAMSADFERKMRDAAGVVTVSEFNVRHLREVYGAAAAVVRIYNGLDLRRLPPVSSRNRPRRIVFIGRLVEKKGVGDLIAACAAMKGGGHDFSCRVIGAGPLEADLRAHAGRLGLEDVVEFVGPLPQADIVSELQQASVCAAPCVVGADGNRDGLPTVILEAMALGAACVATPVTGIPEVVRDGVTGLIVPERDPAGLAAAIVRLLDDESLRCRLASAARALIEREFDGARNVQQLCQLFAGAPAGAPSLAEAV